MGIDIIIKCIIAGIFVAASILLVWAYIRSKGVYDEYIDGLDENDFKLKKMLSIGMFFNERSNVVKFIPIIARDLITKYANYVRSKIIEIYGYKYSEYYFAVHNGSKWSVFLLGSYVSIVLSGITCLKNDLNKAIIFLLISPLVGMVLAYLLDKELNDKIDKRRLSIQIDFPEFISKLLLLVNAGMTISKAWEKIITDNKKISPLYNELNISLAEMRAGKPEAVAYEDFARRCKIKEVIKFVSVIIVNLRKGGAEVVPTLKAQADECWEMRKSAAKRLGEQASTKLMLPMAIMLLGIIIIVTLPAILQLVNAGN